MGIKDCVVAGSHIGWVGVGTPPEDSNGRFLKATIEGIYNCNILKP